MTNTEAAGRPVVTFKKLRTEAIETRLDEEKVLLEPAEFLKLIKYLYGVTIDRPTLQLYSTPRFKLLPPPIHKGGHVSYYLNPEHTQRLGVLLHLRDKHRMQLKDIRKVLDSFPSEYYHLILNGVLTGDELLDFPALLKADFKLKDVVFYKIAGMLATMNKGYWEFIGKEGQQAPREIERSLQQDFSKDLKDLSGWLRTDCRRGIYDIIQDERQRRLIETEDAF
jgi:hypothetical protein